MYLLKCNYATKITTKTQNTLLFRTVVTDLRIRLDEARQKLNVNNFSDWYKVANKDFETVLGSTFENKFNSSPLKLLSSVYPEYEWLPWKFQYQTSPHNFWKDPKNHHKFIESIASKLNIKHVEDWYNVSYQDILDHGGGYLLQLYDYSLVKLVTAMYPEHNWLPWKFARSPKNLWDDINNQRKYMDWVGKELKYKEMSDWYQVTTEDLLQFKAKKLLNMYNDSYISLLYAVYPEYEWLPWKFSRAPNNFWDDINNQRKYMDWLGKQLNVKDMSDWYKVTSEDILKQGRSYLLQLYNNSLINLLYKVYPEYEWLPWRFNRIPKTFWNDINNQKKYLEWVGKEFNIKELDDWYKVTAQELTTTSRGLSKSHNYSIVQLLSVVYPQHEWLPWRFQKVPKNFWDDVSNQRKFMDWLGKELNIKDLDDWYKVPSTDIMDRSAGLFKFYKHSISQMLATIYPEREWLPWKFNKLPNHYWNDVKNQLFFVEWVSKQLGIKELSDWYRVKNTDIISFGGRTLLAQYNNSLSQLLKAIYPDYNWLPMRFEGSSVQDFEVTKLMDTISKNLNINEMKDWYNVNIEKFIELGGGVLLVQHHSLVQLLSIVYSDFKWNNELFSASQNKDIWTDEYLANIFVEWLKKQPKNTISHVQDTILNMNNKINYLLTQLLSQSFPNYDWTVAVSTSTKKSQYILKECIEQLFIDSNNKDIVLLEEYRHPSLIHMSNLELDYYIPQYNIAFEYHGMQHYRKLNMFHNLQSMENLQQRDLQKSETCKELGITLIEVPYWWDRKMSSLAATVYNSRPDLFKQKPQGKAIPSSPPESKEISAQPKASKEFLMTATEWDNDVMDPTGWMMTEKYDGMRLYWNGKQFLSRNGKIVKVPSSIVSQMPSSVSLDGELWTQYGLYQDAVSLLSTGNEEKWSKAIFWIFDSPQLESKPLEERIKFLQGLTLPSFAKVVEFVECKSKEHLKQFSESIAAKGGEGVILREPGSMYKSGRSTSLRRVKPFFDTEVLVLKNQYPHGFLCEQLNGKSIFVNMANDTQQSAKQVEKGSVITVKHSGMNKYGTLMFPQFYRQRTDVQWQDL